MILFLFLCLGLVASSWAQTYPVKPVRFLVGFPPGGGIDSLARLVGMKLQDAIGQPVVIDNKPGANAIIATDYVAKSAPDGYTLLIGASGAMTFNPGLYDKLPYDPQRDFAPVTMLGSYPLVLTVNPGLPVHSVKDLIALAKGSPSTLNYASGSTPFRLASELFITQSGVSVNHVAYKGAAPAITAVMGNEVQFAFVDGPSALPMIKAGRLRALAVTSRTRAQQMPDVPTMVEAGLPDYEVVVWTSLFAPTGTPKPVLDKLHAQVAKILQTPDVQERMATLGINPVGNTPAQLGEIVRADIEKWTAVAKKAGIKAE